MERAEISWNTADGAVPIEASFEEFFEGEQERLLRVLWMVTGSLHEAEDIVQDAFLGVWERWPEVSVMESPVGYLHRAAMNLFRNRYRRAALALRKVAGVTPPPDAWGSVEDRLAVSTALGSLTPRQRAALVLTELWGYNAAEAGRMLGVRGSTVRSLSAAGRTALRNAKELKDE